MRTLVSPQTLGIRLYACSLWGHPRGASRAHTHRNNIVGLNKSGRGVGIPPAVILSFNPTLVLAFKSFPILIRQLS